MKIFNQPNLWHAAINFYQPHDYGGSSEIINKDRFGHVRLFSDKEDLPLIKPKTALNNKNEFNIVFDPQVDLEKADMGKIDKPLIKEWEELVGNAKIAIID